ncbi:MAG: hypothetical protein A3C58_00640 [Candidatus Staskawiczbacteria bacterium RIFCSPHIGHO2_02_FULL_34_10]|uniref:Nudix hydrolase domain-containing protein n=1 Tax=Candidatus Staskawiczbacteria bacterium RIFCSPHIGHO2_02_FULL_34_10 TaxID=1802205 RepID=A0A1G2HUP9_9BACT|nr:MAG: hypothetical protein A3C58_00640 [Candidatus Staskawiczbacteria bacterium RIFCSPHIGHO2_02_FULL_34_10]
MKKIVFQGKKFSIIHKTLHRGKLVKNIEYCQRPTSIIVLVVSKNNKILLLKENSLERRGYSWGLVSGHVEKNEKKSRYGGKKRAFGRG